MQGVEDRKETEEREKGERRNNEDQPPTRLFMFYAAAKYSSPHVPHYREEGNRDEPQSHPYFLYQR